MTWVLVSLVGVVITGIGGVTRSPALCALGAGLAMGAGVYAFLLSL